jgi:lysophospholipase L1-like esterase
LTACYPDYQLQIINRGISGDTSRDLKKRWHNDVIVQQPDWLFLKIGINDVWRLLDGRLTDAVLPQEFAANVRRCLDWTQQETASQIVLVEPFLVEPNPADPFRHKLTDYQTALAAISQQYTLPLVPLQSAFDAAGQHKPGGKWAEDRVHPTQIGHTLIAATILRHCGFNWQ